MFHPEDPDASHAFGTQRVRWRELVWPENLVVWRKSLSSFSHEFRKDLAKTNAANSAQELPGRLDPGAISGDDSRIAKLSVRPGATSERYIISNMH